LVQIRGRKFSLDSHQQSNILYNAFCAVFTVTKHVSVIVGCVKLSYVPSMTDEFFNEVRHEAVLEYFNEL
jgi:hypothetical protein